MQRCPAHSSQGRTKAGTNGHDLFENATRALKTTPRNDDEILYSRTA
jgi:hypothetical protein